MLGHALLRRNCLDATIALNVELPYYEWPEVTHQRSVYIRAKLNEKGFFTGVRGANWSELIDPHFHQRRTRGQRNV